MRSVICSNQACGFPLPDGVYVCPICGSRPEDDDSDDHLPLPVPPEDDDE